MKSVEKGLGSKGFVELILWPKRAKSVLTELNLETYAMLSQKLNKNHQKSQNIVLHQWVKVLYQKVGLNRLYANYAVYLT